MIWSTQRHTQTHIAFRLCFIGHNVLLYGLSTVLNAAERMSQPHPAPVPLSVQLPRFTVGSAVTCRQAQSALWVPHSSANPQYTHAHTRQTHTQTMGQFLVTVLTAHCSLLSKYPELRCPLQVSMCLWRQTSPSVLEQNMYLI